MIRCTLPIEPVAWERVKRDAKGRAYVPPKTRRFKREAAWLARGVAPRALLDGPLRLRIRFVLRRPGSVRRKHPAVRPDLDNYIKAVKDALNGVIWTDDARICELVASKVYDLTGGGPRIDLEVEAIDRPESRELNAERSEGVTK